MCVDNLTINSYESQHGRLKDVRFCAYAISNPILCANKYIGFGQILRFITSTKAQMSLGIDSDWSEPRCSNTQIIEIDDL